MNTLIKECLLCSKKLVGRSDKKFCNDHCRNEFNNRLNSDENNLMRRVNYALRKNRRILLEFLSMNKTMVSQQELSVAGFDFRHFTSCDRSPNNRTTYMVYEMAFVLHGAIQVEIIHPLTSTPGYNYFDPKPYTGIPARA